MKVQDLHTLRYIQPEMLHPIPFSPVVSVDGSA